MKDVALALKGHKVEERQFEKVRTRITKKYWFGWSGGYGHSIKKV